MFLVTIYNMHKREVQQVLATAVDIRPAFFGDRYDVELVQSPFARLQFPHRNDAAEVIQTDRPVRIMHTDYLAVERPSGY